MDYKAQIDEASKDNAFKIGAYRELRRLPLYLHENERVIKIVVGAPHKTNRMGHVSSKPDSSRGLVVATNERILFLRDGWVFRTSQDYLYDTISSIEFNTGIFFGSIRLNSKGDETKYSWVGRVAGAEFVKVVRELMSKHRAGLHTPTQPLTINPQQEELTVLDAALRYGQITQEHYDIQRERILGR